MDGGEGGTVQWNDEDSVRKVKHSDFKNGIRQFPNFMVKQVSWNNSLLAF